MTVMMAGTGRIQFNFGFEVCWRPSMPQWVPEGREYEKMCLVLYLRLSAWGDKCLLYQWFPFTDSIWNDKEICI